VPIRWHEETPDDLCAAIRFTAETSRFLPRLLEKDYFCSVVLEAFTEADTSLVFKGGTALAKIHSGFFRLSEDLDFTLPMPPEATRAARRRAIEPFKAVLAALPGRISVFEIAQPLRGHNDSKQYNAARRCHPRLFRRRSHHDQRPPESCRSHASRAPAAQARRSRHPPRRRLRAAAGASRAATREPPASRAPRGRLHPLRSRTRHPHAAGGRSRARAPPMITSSTMRIGSAGRASTRTTRSPPSGHGRKRTAAAGRVSTHTRVRRLGGRADRRRGRHDVRPRRRVQSVVVARSERHQLAEAHRLHGAHQPARRQVLVAYSPQRTRSRPGTVRPRLASRRAAAA